MSSENQWADGASDTDNVLNGTALGALLGGSGEAAGFSIDYERVPQAIADLEEAARFFRSRAKTALRLADIRPPGTDGVSVNAAAQIGRWASDSGVNNRTIQIDTFTNNLTLEAVYDRRQGLFWRY